MPYLTPDEIPEDDDCRPLSIPASTDWLAIVSGALTELTKTWNWEQQGAVTVDEAVERMQEMIDGYYSGCTACELPGGGSALRIRTDGHLEEILPDGEWGEPTGDYVIPPPEARTGGTALDQQCLAAANATNVLQQLYESIADSFAEDLDEAEAVTDMIAVLIVLVGFEFAPIAFALATFLIAIFRIAYRAVEFITADLWDETFSDQLKCILYECSSNDDGVVTFDWECFNDALYRQLNTFALTEDQLRLYAQIQIIIQIIGGIDAINLAGRTTEITVADCEECNECPEDCLVPDAGLWHEPACSGSGNLDFTEEGMFSNIHNVGLSQGAICDLNDVVAPGSTGWIICYTTTTGITMTANLVAEEEGIYPACYSGSTMDIGSPENPVIVPASMPIVFLGWAADDNGITGLCVAPI